MSVVIFILSLACLVAAMVVLVLVRTLPAQNVSFITVVLVVAEALLEYWARPGDLPDGAFFWPGAIILARTGIQILLKPYRQSSNYGIFLIGMTSGAVAVVQFITDSGRYAAVRFCLTAVCLLFLTPWFLQKRVTTSGQSKR